MDTETRLRYAATFDRAADLYDRARPGYPTAAVDWVLPPGATRVLDLAAGTGKLTDSLTGRGLDVIAVDISPAMLDHLSARHPEVDVRVAKAESTGLDDASVDAVLVGAAFHWFTRPEADAEIARILRPGGMVGLFNNQRDRSNPTAAAFDRIAKTTEPARAARDHHAGLDRMWFSPTERADFPHSMTLTTTGLVELVASRSYVIDLDDDERAAVLAKIEAFAHDQLGLRDQATIELAFNCEVRRARRL